MSYYTDEIHAFLTATFNPCCGAGTKAWAGIEPKLFCGAGDWAVISLFCPQLHALHGSRAEEIIFLITILLNCSQFLCCQTKMSKFFCGNIRLELGQKLNNFGSATLLLIQNHKEWFPKNKVKLYHNPIKKFIINIK